MHLQLNLVLPTSLVKPASSELTCFSLQIIPAPRPLKASLKCNKMIMKVQQNHRCSIGTRLKYDVKRFTVIWTEGFSIQENRLLLDFQDKAELFNLIRWTFFNHALRSTIARPYSCSSSNDNSKIWMVSGGSLPTVDGPHPCGILVYLNSKKSPLNSWLCN
jgi:hypothetical protein